MTGTGRTDPVTTGLSRVMLGRVAWASALLAAGAAQLSGAWAGWQSLAVMVAAAVVPVGLVMLAGRLRQPTGRTVAVLMVLLLAGAYLATRGTGAGPLAALRDAVPRLLTGARPAPATPDALMPGALAAALVGLWTGVLVSRQRPALLAPPVAAALLYTGGALLTAGDGDRYGLAACGLLLLTMAGWLLLGRPGHGPVSAGASLSAVACCAGVALLVGLLPTTGAFDPRRLIAPPSFTVAESNPLTRLAAWATAGDVELLRMRGQPQRLRLVTLSEYTGASWRAAGIYRPLGTIEEPALPPGQRRIGVDVEVRVAGLDGPWLPVAGEPDTVTLHDIAVDPDSGSTAVRGGLSAGLRYRMRGRLDDGGAEELAAAGVPGADLAGRYLATPGLPWHLAEYARLVMRNANTPYEQAVAIEYAVRAGRKLDAGAPSGSSYARLTTFLAGKNAEPGAQAGTSEQFAAAFAVLARAVALPTRIVVGFGPGEPGPDGMQVVRGRHAMAWPEVYFTGWGWQPFDPTPASGAVTGAADEAAKRAVLARLAERSAVPVQSNEPTPSRSPPTSPTPTTDSRASAPPAETVWDSRTFVILGAILLAPFALLAGLRAVRRARHRRSGALGAWSEVLDLLVLLGRPAPRSQPAPETAAALAVRLPVRWPAVDNTPHPAVWLAEAADRVRFGPGPHRPDARTWSILRYLRRAARHATPWYRRLHWPIDPRPLGRR